MWVVPGVGFEVQPCVRYCHKMLAVISDHQLHIAPVYLTERELFRGSQAETHRVNIKPGCMDFTVDVEAHTHLM